MKTNTRRTRFRRANLAVGYLFFELMSVFGRVGACRLTKTWRDFDGIRLIAYHPYRLESLSEVGEALELVRQKDLRRFNRIKKYVKQIVLADWRAIGSYLVLSKVCHLRKLPVSQNDQHLAVYVYAALLVHEATHGLLEKKGFEYLPNKKRIESLCNAEMARFLKIVIGRSPGSLEIWTEFLRYLARVEGKSISPDFLEKISIFQRNQLP
jgi:hypothetical protein